MNSVKLDGKTVYPSKVICIGRNYVAHIRELNNEIPTEPVFFLKPNSAITSELYALQGEPLHYEGELSFLVRSGQLAAIGFGLDLTKRALQSRLKEKGLPWERSKAFDHSALFSEFVTFSGDTRELVMELRINGEIAQRAGCERMLHQPQEILEQAGSIFSFEDDDLLMTGTPEGVGVIRPGDEFVGRILERKQVLIEAHWIASTGRISAG